jgi:diguanylate cyclase (GGDEF)-like protein/PAS domain S-box-containing protein
MSRRRWWLYGLWTALVMAVYLFIPSVTLPAFLLIAGTNVTAILIGVRRNRPRRRLPWLLLAFSNLTFATGTITAVVLQEVLHQTAFPSIADAIFLGLCFPTLLLSLLSLTRSGAVLRDRSTMIDGLILTAGAGFLSWTFLIGPYLENPQLSLVEKVISIAYPLCDVLVLAILSRLAIGARLSWSVVLLIASGVGLLTADVLYSLNQLNGADWGIGGPVDIGWATFYFAGGAAALHPSMVALTEPRMLRPTEMKVRRVVLGVASLVAPTVLLVQALSGPVRDGVVIAIASAVLVLLAIARMSVVAAGLRHTMTRERELRRACEALLSAADSAQVRRVVIAAVAALLPPETNHSAVLVTPDREDRDRDLDGGQADAGFEPASGASMTYAAATPVDVARQLSGFELALHCPLTIRATRVGDLYVGSDELALVNLQESVPVLAGQAASILDHLALNREINRRESEAYFRTLVLNAADVILIADADNRITYASPSAQPVLRTATLTGSDLLDLVEPAYRAEAGGLIRSLRAGGGALDVSDWPVRRADGERAEMEISIRDLRTEPTVAGLVFTLRDVTERRRLERELRERAYLDPLTGLGNRLQFHDCVQRAIDSRAGGTVCVLLINIDDFRVVNDTMGQAVGDELLIAIGGRLALTLGERGPVARLGADEFGVVATLAGDPAAERLAAEVLAAFDEPFLAAGTVLTVQPSIGVATAGTTTDAASAQRLLTQADVALGTAKTEGKARWRRYEASLHAQVLRRMELRTELDQALADGAFTVYYQPIVDIATGLPCGLEALVRWQHPTRGTVPPLEFIQIAEESGLIVPLGEWVLHAALVSAAGWRRAYPDDPPYVSVNVSVRQFRAPGFVERVMAQLTATGLPPHLLTLEITESLLLGDQERIYADIVRLRAAGIRISIDDFGTGYSSLSYLHRVPVDAVKLDKSFVDTIAASSQQFDLVRGIIQLVSTLHLKVVAEGVETADDRARLAEAGCGYAQGYMFAQPMPEPEVDGWLRAHALTATVTG